MFCLHCLHTSFCWGESVTLDFLSRMLLECIEGGAVESFPSTAPFFNWFCNFEGLVAVVQKWFQSFQDTLISDMNPAYGGGMALPVPGKAFFHFAICDCNVSILMSMTDQTHSFCHEMSMTKTCMFLHLSDKVQGSACISFDSKGEVMVLDARALKVIGCEKICMSCYISYFEPWLDRPDL